MRRLLFFLIVTNAAMAQTQVYTVETVPNVKVESNNYVSNPDGILLPETASKIDSQLRALESSTTAQIAVVAINSIGDQDIFNFAQELFTKWGIGQKSNDNGLLILLVLDKRTVRFQTGKGLEGILPDIVCKRIEEQDMVPLFKEEKNDEAMTAGVDHVVKVLTDPIYADEILAKELRNYSGWVSFFPMTLGVGLLTLLVIFLVNKNKFTDSKKPLSTPYGEMRMSRMGWLTEFGIVPVAILLVFQFSPMINPILECLAALYGYFIFTLIVKRVRMRGVVKRLIEKEKYKKVFDFFEEYRAGWLVYGILFPIPLLPHYFMYRNRMVFYRNHPRACEKCGKPARKLDEQTEDKYLSKEKAFEEGLKSADYDVWLCDACGTYFELVYQNRFSKFSPCPKCKTKAWYQKSNRTIDSPTESSSGKGERTFECKFCNHSLSTTYTIARLSSSSSSSSSGGSSGGSFGGGSSGGGGASSSW